MGFANVRPGTRVLIYIRRTQATGSNLEKLNKNELRALCIEVRINGEGSKYELVERPVPTPPKGPLGPFAPRIVPGVWHV